MTRKKRWMIFAVIALMFASAMAATSGITFFAGAQAKPTVVVSVAPQATFVQEVTGDLVNVVTMLPPGANHETYSPPPQDMEQFSRASLYLAIGLPAERSGIMPKAADLNRELKVVDVQNEVAKSFAPRYFAPDDQDPHIWLSPKRAALMVRLTATELSALDPANKSTYESNAERYIAQIEATDREARDSFNGLQNRTFIVYHPAFGYFADDYSLTMVALEEEGKEADPRHMREMIDMAREKGIKIIFYQEDIDGRQSRTFAEELGGRAEKVSPMAADYVNNIRLMARTIAGGLQ